MMMMIMIIIIVMIINLIITQSAAISQSTFCFVLPSFFNMGTPSISKFSYCCYSVSSSSSPSPSPFLPFFPLQATQLFVQHMALGS
jgi:hypothetical protein